MTIYLTIITTVLVLTQVIRLIQNCKSLKNFKKTDMQNVKLIEEWKVVIDTLQEIMDREELI